MSKRADLPQHRSPALLKRSPRRGIAMVLGLVLLVVVTTADYLTGPYLAFSTLYLLPVMVMAWYASRRWALAGGAVAAAVGTIAVASHNGAVPGITLIANGVLRFVTFVVVVVLVQAERTSLTRIAKLSETDPLTGLLNRRAFSERGQERLRQSARNGEPVTCIYIDLDDLKECNDAFGHEAGDRLITTLVGAMTATFRETDLLTRIGGDEFGCLCCDTDQELARVVIARLNTSLGRIEPEPVSASVGAVTTVPDETTDIAALIHAADTCMYKAKSAGKGQYRVRDFPPSDAVADRPS